VTFFSNYVLAQEIDADDLLDRIDRLEKNIYDLQKGKVEAFEKSISSGYISRNEKRFDDLETKNRLNYGIIEELQNKINSLDEKLNLINSEFQSRISDLENKLTNLKENELRKSNVENKLNLQNSTIDLKKTSIDDVKSSEEPKPSFNQKLSEPEIKKKYESAIKLLWASKYVEAQKELEILKELNPEDLMPNIQYWLGEVHYAQKNFEKAIIEFGEGLKNYPESIKGPDNLLKLGLSFSNLKKNNEACNVLYELEIKYKDAPKNVLDRAANEIKKLKCPKE
tara:strand:- start:627 stop:1472 length:846 start_codon:yes stop_codon:yes gene_type:complete